MGEEEEEDLDAALANLDIDRDFGMSFSNIEGVEVDEEEDDDNNGTATAPENGKKAKETQTEDHHPQTRRQQHQQVMEGPQHWKMRLARDEIFSKLYRPNKQELKERESVAAHISGVSLFPMGDAVFAKLLLDDPNNNNNIVCKRGMVKMGGQDRELVLLTQGFVLARPASGQLLSKLVNKTHDACHLYIDMEWVKDLWQLSGHEFSLRDRQYKRELRLAVDTAEEKEAWLDAFERVLLQSKERYEDAEEKEHRIVGWQHALVQRSLYTAAVTGAAFFGQEHLTHLNELDNYNGLGALHYAAIHNNIHVIEHLVRVAGADIELKDEEGRTPMYYAQRDNMQPSIITMRELGAKDSVLFETEAHGALAQEAREMEKRKEHEKKRREEEEAEMQQILARGGAERPRMAPSSKQKSFLGLKIPPLGLQEEQQQQRPAHAEEAQGLAQQAHSNMHDAMNALRERGEKINELGEKTTQLEQGANEYADLASKLRQKMEQRNKSILNPFGGWGR